MKNTSTKPPLAQSSKDAHTLNHTTPSPPFLQTTARRYTNPVFFNLVTPSWITTSDISASPKTRFLIAWLSLTISSLFIKLRLQIPCTSISPSPTIEGTFGIQPNICDGAFIGNIVNLLKPLTAFTEGLHCRCLTRF